MSASVTCTISGISPLLRFMKVASAAATVAAAAHVELTRRHSPMCAIVQLSGPFVLHLIVLEMSPLLLVFLVRCIFL